MISITQIRKLRVQAHALKPVVLIGKQGLTENVQLEIDHALEAHELIKIKMNTDRKTQKSYTEKLCDTLNAEYINEIGHTVILYRKKQKS